MSHCFIAEDITKWVKRLVVDTIIECYTRGGINRVDIIIRITHQSDTACYLLFGANSREGYVHSNLINSGTLLRNTHHHIVVIVIAWLWVVFLKQIGISLRFQRRQRRSSSSSSEINRCLRSLRRGKRGNSKITAGIYKCCIKGCYLIRYIYRKNARLTTRNVNLIHQFGLAA